MASRAIVFLDKYLSTTSPMRVDEIVSKSILIFKNESSTKEDNQTRIRIVSMTQLDHNIIYSAMFGQMNTQA